jgi:chitodextrinase
MKRARLAGALLLLPLAFLVLPVTSAYAASGTATFTKTSTWDTGYQAQYTITNTGTTAVSGWTVEFDLPSGTTAGTYWDATLTQTGSHYAFKNRDYNGSIAPGASTSFGFVASGTGTPTGCTLNGASCTGDGGGTDTQPPSVPGGLTVTGHTSSSVSLSWTASTDNVGVTGYEVYQGSSLATTVTGTSATVSGLSASTSYTFKVRARDAAGNLSAFGSSVSASTDASGGGGGSGIFSPYVDITMATPALRDVANATGQKHYTAATRRGAARSR